MFVPRRVHRTILKRYCSSILKKTRFKTKVSFFNTVNFDEKRVRKLRLVFIERAHT